MTPQISGVIFFFFIQDLNVQLFYIPKYMKLHCSNIFYKMFLKATTRPSSYSHRVTLLDFVPLPESTNQHHTMLTHNHVPMTLHRTPNTVPIPTMHSHPCHAMFSGTCNAIMPNVYIICAHILMHIHPCII